MLRYFGGGYEAVIALHGAEFRRCLENLDVAAAWRLWVHAIPHLPQPVSDDNMLATLHHARTQTGSIRSELRFYSHRWLLDHDLPSGLPDSLMPAAERAYPAKVEAIGIAVMARDGDLARAEAVRTAMEHAAKECQADGENDNAVIKSHMMEARIRVLRER
jgi:hypothetical protein